MSVRAAGATRVRARCRGTVQGVGFRPYVVPARDRAGAGRLRAQRRARRAARGRGRRGARSSASSRGCAAEAPPLARGRERGRARSCRPAAERGFEIVHSVAAGEPAAPVSPDTATCDDCLAELFDPADRRYRYPFINCTNCGPRFTIVRGVPYDRPLTTMAGFEMCARAGPSTRTRATAASTPSRTPARHAARRLRLAGSTDGDPAASEAVQCAARRADRGREGRRRLPPRLPRRRRARGRGAARAQAPRGQAVRADGARRWRRRGRWWSSARRRRRCSPAASGRS